MIGWMQQRAYLKSLRAEQREVTFQAVRSRREAEGILQSVMQMSGIKSAEIVDLPNGQFQVVAKEESVQRKGIVRNARTEHRLRTR